LAGWFNCNNSSARLAITMDVFQYGHRTAHRSWTEFNIDTGEIFDAARIDIYGLYDYPTALHAGEWAAIGLRIDLHASARGQAWSKLNFHDGVANYIEPEIVAAVPPS
jgi:hypothetical protein